MLFFIMLLSDEDNDKFTRIYTGFHDLLLRYAFNMLKDMRIAEEVTHDAFVKILGNLDKLSENEPSKIWYYMTTIVRHISYDTYKKELSSKFANVDDGNMDTFEDKSEPVWSAYQAKELYQQIRDYITTNLNESDRVLLTLRSTREMPYKKIAEIVGESEGNVSVRLTRLRKKMKDALGLKGERL